jgi:hypothetical protein
MVDNEEAMVIAVHGLDYPWTLNTRELQLRWWERYGERALRDVKMAPELEATVRSRPPDRIRYVGEEKHSSDRIERRHTLFKTWPVKVESDTIYDLLGLSWELPDGRLVALKIPVNRRTYTSEKEVAGA